MRYNIYKINERTAHSCLKPGEQGVKNGDYLITTKEVEGITKYKELDTEIVSSSYFYLKVAFCNSGTEVLGLKTGSKFKSYSKDDIILKVENACGVKLSIESVKFLLAPDRVKCENIRNAFEIYAKIERIDDLEKLKEKILTGIGSRKSYGFGQIVLFNINSVK
jgi:hypothetical protein